MTGITGSHAARWHVLVLVAFTLMIGASAARAVNPEGQLTWGVHVSLAPTWFDPAETQGIITPYLVMYAPIMDLRVLMGVGPRIAKHTITDVWMSPFPSYEDIELKH